MFIRYYIVLCFMCYTPTGKYINDEQIKMLWDAFRVNKYYIFLIDLTNVYADEDPNELEEVLKSYGSKYDNKNVSEIGMRKENFVSAARDGRFHRWTKWAMTTEFRDIIPEEEHRDYIILDDMIKYYEKNISKPELIDVINKYGQLKDGVYQLHFHNFRRALNMGLLPEPLCDESQSLLAIYTVYSGITKEEKCRRITKTLLARYYRPQIDDIFEEYADSYGYGKHILFFYCFKKAVINGNIPIPMYKKHESRQVISKRRLTSQTLAKLQSENEKLKKEVLALKTMNAQCRDNKTPQVGNSVNNPNQATIQEIRAPYKSTIRVVY